MNAELPIQDVAELPPDCERFQDEIQLFLDGTPLDQLSFLRKHAELCAGCRSLLRLSQRLRTELPKQPLFVPSVSLQQSIFQSILKDQKRRRRQQKWESIVWMMAASVFIFTLSVSLWKIFPNTQDVRESQVRLPSRETVVQLPETPSIRKTMSQAGSALAKLTMRKAESTAERTRPLLKWPKLDQAATQVVPIQPTIQTLSEVRDTAASSFAPVTNSAIRAVDVFWKELAPSTELTKNKM